MKINFSRKKGQIQLILTQSILGKGKENSSFIDRDYLILKNEIFSLNQRYSINILITSVNNILIS